MSLCEIGYHLLLDVIIQNNNKSEFSPGFTATIKKQLFQHIQQQPPDKARSFRDMWCSFAFKASNFVAIARVLVVDWMSYFGEWAQSPQTPHVE